MSSCWQDVASVIDLSAVVAVLDTLVDQCLKLAATSLWLTIPTPNVVMCLSVECVSLTSLTLRRSRKSHLLQCSQMTDSWDQRHQFSEWHGWVLDLAGNFNACSGIAHCACVVLHQTWCSSWAKSETCHHRPPNSLCRSYDFVTELRCGEGDIPKVQLYQLPCITKNCRAIIVL